jgi:hypothetical protein
MVSKPCNKFEVQEIMYHKDGTVEDIQSLPEISKITSPHQHAPLAEGGTPQGYNSLLSMITQWSERLTSMLTNPYDRTMFEAIHSYSIALYKLEEGDTHQWHLMKVSYGWDVYPWASRHEPKGLQDGRTIPNWNFPAQQGFEHLMQLLPTLGVYQGLE